MRSEVRRCTGCGAAAAVQTGATRHVVEMSMNGLPATSTSTRRRFRCQQCGAAFELRPQGEGRTQLVISALFMALIAGLGVFLLRQPGLSGAGSWVLLPVLGPFELAFGVWLAVALRRLGTWTRHPVVADAPMPPMQFPEPPAQQPRPCPKCGAQAALTSVVRHRTQGLPTGSEWTFTCEACAHRFTRPSRFRAMVPELLFLLLLAAGLVALMVPHPHLWLGGLLGASAVLVLRGAYVTRR